MGPGRPWLPSSRAWLPETSPWAGYRWGARPHRRAPHRLAHQLCALLRFGCRWSSCFTNYHVGRAPPEGRLARLRLLPDVLRGALQLILHVLLGGNALALDALDALGRGLFDRLSSLLRRLPQIRRDILRRLGGLLLQRLSLVLQGRNRLLLAL